MIVENEMEKHLQRGEDSPTQANSRKFQKTY